MNDRQNRTEQNRTEQNRKKENKTSRNRIPKLPEMVAISKLSYFMSVSKFIALETRKIRALLSVVYRGNSLAHLTVLLR